MPYGAATYTYNVADQLTELSDPMGATTTITYNLAGWKTSMTDPDMGTWYYRYDNAGKLTKQRDARTKAVCFHYDSLGRLEGKSYHDNPTGIDNLNCGSTYTVTYTYDSTSGGNEGIGRRTGMTDPSGSATWIYDARGQITRESKAITGDGTFRTVWAYDDLGRVITMTYPGGSSDQTGEVVTSTYDTAGQLDSVVGTSRTYVDDTTYNALGQVLTRDLGGTQGYASIRQKYTYHSTNFRLTDLESGTTSPYTNKQDISYTYDNKGNVLTITDASAYGGSQTQTFTYDKFDRQYRAEASGTQANGGYSQAWNSYDESGNLTSLLGTSQWYSDTNHIHAITHIGGSRKYYYDANGNVTRRINGAQDIDLTYDYENRLTNVSDGDGNLVKRDGNALIGNYFEWTGSSGKKHYYAGGTRVASTSGVLYWLLTDHLGSSTLTLSADGNTRAGEQCYYPFGLDRYKYGTLYTDYRFTGQRVEDNTDLYFYQSRWYDPVVGRFLQPDTIVPEPGNPQSLNRYSYVLNNPLRYVDPTGHSYSEGGAPGGDCKDTVEGITQWLLDNFGITVQGNWTLLELRDIRSALQYMRSAAARTTGDGRSAVGTVDAMLNGVVINRLAKNTSRRFQTFTTRSRSNLPKTIQAIGSLPVELWVHEMGHMVDYAFGDRNGGEASAAMQHYTDREDSPTKYGQKNRLEDFAESFDIWVMGEKNPDGTTRNWRQGKRTGQPLNADRREFMEALTVAAWARYKFGY